MLFCMFMDSFIYADPRLRGYPPLCINSYKCVCVCVCVGGGGAFTVKVEQKLNILICFS